MKYIDADRLKAEIERRMTENCELAEKAGGAFGQRAVEDNDILALVDTLQQDETQVDKMLCSQVWWEEQGWIMIPPDATIEGIDSLLRQVRKKLQQEQPEVDLKKIIERTYHDGSVADTDDMDHVTYENIARHFYGLRNRALEEAARHVYESWMGGTMDDVRRDMVELGKVLNARKEKNK